MKSFKEFGIKPETKGLIGEKIKMSKILNRSITVVGFLVKPSIYEGKGRCLHMQIVIDNENRVVFVGANMLIEQIQKVPAEGFPFTTTIANENNRYEFT